jgi:hypothetical protein
MGMLEGNEPTTPNTWEQIKRTPNGVQNWINENIRGKSCLIVLIGSETSDRPWVKYEIEQAWKAGKAVFGIYIHNLKCPRNGTCSKGANPFNAYTFTDSKGRAYVPKVYDPPFWNTYNYIAENISMWIEKAIAER